MYESRPGKETSREGRDANEAYDSVHNCVPRKVHVYSSIEPPLSYICLVAQTHRTNHVRPVFERTRKNLMPSSPYTTDRERNRNVKMVTGVPTEASSPILERYHSGYQQQHRDEHTAAHIQPLAMNTPRGIIKPLITSYGPVSFLSLRVSLRSLTRRRRAAFSTD